MIYNLLRLMRVRQWYKNILVFVAIVFSGNILNFDMIVLSLIAFVSLSLMSSVNYIINDFVDVGRDKNHVEKKDRPLASGRISKNTGILLAIVFFVISVFLASYLNKIFLGLILLFFVLTQSYSFLFKNEPFLDVLLIAINFVIRAVSGAFVINVRISEWLILCSFFLALFLAFSKREGDLKFVKNASTHKPVLKYYSLEMLHSFKLIMSGLLIMSYSLYSLLTNQLMMFTLPFALYAIFRYYYLSEQNSEIVRHLELFVKDKRLLVSIFLWGVVSGLVLYYRIILTLL